MSSSDQQLRQYYLARERSRKIELVIVATLWLLGCPILCVLPQTNSGTTWNEPDALVCGLNQYSISASMTGHYPKIWGSIFATLFAVLIVQRTSNGLCPALRLGWLARYSRLVSRSDVDNKHPSSEYTLFRDFYERIQRIETFGYIAGSCLVALVILDAQYFPTTHIILAQIAFASLYRQDWSVGTLGQDFPQLLPKWTSEHGRHIFYVGMVHFVLLMVPLIVLHTLHDAGFCGDFNIMIQSVSRKLFIAPDTLVWTLSVAIWYPEYVFCLCCVYIQLLEHFEVQLWDFVGAPRQVYLEILPRFSVAESVQMALGCGQKGKCKLDILTIFLSDGQRKEKII